ncbi:hypothetical protein BZA05DRAFT_435440 [Tricharina praecox]|uniref:uncharacterized protein n=1 Tax=Tricharina praecox TaxID=43433 RepID=UPI002220B76D|nr:uncharacterized protein BZA05DRAFT_435440 [Tricharina praecox]KAI5854464.1 hypothetical protein BZA05DRAFT_435440 [Tricharina praecox]
MSPIRPSSAPPLSRYRVNNIEDDYTEEHSLYADMADTVTEEHSIYSDIAETATPPDSPHAPPSLVDSDASTISSSSSDTSGTSPPLSATHYRHHTSPGSVSYPEKYTRTFTSRLLGFPQTIVDPSVVTSYSPCTGFSHTLWTPATPSFPHKSKFRSAAHSRLDTYIDPSCIIVSVVGRLNAATNTLTYGIFHGPGSARNLSGVVPHGANERTRTRLHAELYATEQVLAQVLSLLQHEGAGADGGGEWPTARNVVLVTDSRRVMHALSSCVYTWKANGWTRARGKKAVANAAAWKAILELVEKVEARGVGVRVWTIAENVNADAMLLAAAAEHSADRKGLPYGTAAMVPASPVYPQGWQQQQQQNGGYRDPGYGYHAPVYGNNGCVSCGWCWVYPSGRLKVWLAFYL